MEAALQYIVSVTQPDERSNSAYSKACVALLTCKGFQECGDHNYPLNNLCDVRMLDSGVVEEYEHVQGMLYRGFVRGRRVHIQQYDRIFVKDKPLAKNTNANDVRSGTDRNAEAQEANTRG